MAETSNAMPIEQWVFINNLSEEIAKRTNYDTYFDFAFKVWQNKDLIYSYIDVYKHKNNDAESFTDDLLNRGYTKGKKEGIRKGRESAIEDVKSWFTEEFKKQNDPNSKFVPSCVIKENIYDVLEQIKETKHE